MLVGSLSNQSGHGMLKLAGYIKCITFGSIRTFRQHLKYFLAFTLLSLSDLATRKEMREQAWQLDGWADTVSKVHVHVLHIVVR